MHADFVEVPDDRHPRVFGGEVPSNDDDELESLRDGDSVVTDFDVEEDVFVSEVAARVPRGGSAEVRAALRSLDDVDLDTLSDPSVRHAEHSSFLAGPVPHLHAVRHGRNYSRGQF